MKKYRIYIEVKSIITKDIEAVNDQHAETLLNDLDIQAMYGNGGQADASVYKMEEI
jgi:hypothetical protein